ncbi:transposable element Tcb1 transposase [Trichonephila clavipes]|nr:transposable element Tcb1 transposase [Trichonephila clavipes]
MQEETTNWRGRLHPSRCSTASDDRRIVCMVVMDHAATSRTKAQQIQSITHHLVRRRLQQSGTSPRCPLLRLPLTENHRHLRRRWCDERLLWTMEWNDIMFTDESRLFLQHHDGRIQVCSPTW